MQEATRAAVPCEEWEDGKEGEREGGREGKISEQQWIVQFLNMHTCTKYILAVSGMSILCLWNIQLTFDWDKVEPSKCVPWHINLSECPGILFGLFLWNYLKLYTGKVNTSE